MTPYNKFLTEQLNLFLADKTGKVDYALSDNGAKVVAVQLNKPTATSPSAVQFPFAYLGSLLNLGALFNGHENKEEIRFASKLITSEITPGNCWSFTGHIANITIKLSCPIIISSVSIEHPDPRILMNDMNSAPNKFQVFGTTVFDSQNITQTLLLEGEYKYPGQLLQEYHNNNPKEWSHITLAILSNHHHHQFGNIPTIDYTCVYRFRVHSTNGCSQIKNKEL